VSDQQTVAAIRKLVVDELLEEEVEIDETTPLFAEGLVDSMNLVRLLALLEETFEIKVPVSMVNDQNLADIASIARLVSQIRP
jgi:acyl carrier protein